MSDHVPGDFLTLLRERVCGVLDGLVGVQNRPYVIANATPPFAEIDVGPTEYDLAFQRGFDRITITVRVIVGSTTGEAAQKRLDTFMQPAGGQSVKALLEEDKTLGRLVASLHVQRCSGTRMYQSREGTPWLGADWTCEVLF